MSGTDKSAPIQEPRRAAVGGFTPLAPEREERRVFTVWTSLLIISDIAVFSLDYQYDPGEPEGTTQCCQKYHNQDRRDKTLTAKVR